MKELSDYTTYGLLTGAAQVKSPHLKAMMLAELRRRRAAAREKVHEHNATERIKLQCAVEIEGLRSQDEYERTLAKRALLKTARDVALEETDIPEGDNMQDVIHRHHVAITATAKKYYHDARRSYMRESAAADPGRAPIRVVHKERLASRRAESAAYQATRFPTYGMSVYFNDSAHAEPQTGVIRGVYFRRQTCAFCVRVFRSDGRRFDRSFSTLTPVNECDKELFEKTRADCTRIEEVEKNIKEHAELVIRIDEYRRRAAELEGVISTARESDFYKNWVATDSTARDYARRVRVETEGGRA